MIFHDFSWFFMIFAWFFMSVDNFWVLPVLLYASERSWMLLDALGAPGSCMAVCSPHFQGCPPTFFKSQIQIFRKKSIFFFEKNRFFFLAQKKFWVDLGMGKHPNHRFSMFNWSSARSFEYFWCIFICSWLLLGAVWQSVVHIRCGVHRFFRCGVHKKIEK